MVTDLMPSDLPPPRPLLRQTKTGVECALCGMNFEVTTSGRRAWGEHLATEHIASEEVWAWISWWALTQLTQMGGRGSS